MSIRSTLRWARIGMVSTLILGMSLNNAGAWGWLRCRGWNAQPATCCGPAVVTECAPVCCDGGTLSSEVVEPCGAPVAEGCCPDVSEPVTECCTGSSADVTETAPTPMEATPGSDMTHPADPAPTPATPTPADPAPMAEPAPMGEPATPASSSEPAPMEPAPQPETPAPATTPPQAEAEAADPLLGDPGLTSDPDSAATPADEAAPLTDDPAAAMPADAMPADDSSALEPSSDPAADAPATDAPATEAPAGEAPAGDATSPDGLDSFDFGDAPAADGATAEGAAADPVAPAESAPAAEEAAPPTETPADEKDANDLLDGLGHVPQPRGTSRLISVRSQHLPQRFWSDSTGQFHTTGKLVDIGPGAVRLLKDNGRFTTVAISKLSRIDRAYIRAVETNLSNPMSVAATK